MSLEVGKVRLPPLFHDLGHFFCKDVWLDDIPLPNDLAHGPGYQTVAYLHFHLVAR
jgi:hypothetical protein